jgi:signal transduction histidine kinase
VKKLQRAKKGGLKSRLFDLNDVLEEVISEFAIIPNRDVEIEYTPEIGFFIQANELIKDVFSNIVGNAVKHTPADQPLKINIRIIMVTEQGHNYNVVMVEDNGPGIPDGKKGLLFDRYSSAPDKRQKGGLGLELVHSLVSDFRGRVWIEDRVAGDHSQGSRFIVMLPAVET